jgi:anthranilate phosphoribosyltransferase
MEEIMTGAGTPAQLGAFLTALRLKGETTDELTGLARVMREKAVHVSLPASIQAVDTCGTGGDAAGTFNVSTAAGLVAAAAGQPVAKHGNRAASSQCGSADVLEALGVVVDLSAAQVADCVSAVGFGFMFAPSFHPAMRYVGGPRREIGIRTTFNMLGPLTNPAGVRYQLLGVAEAKHVPLMGEALLRLGCVRACVIYGEDGVDEISLSAPTLVCEVDGAGGDVRHYRITPEEFGVSRSSRAAVRGGGAVENAALLRAIMAGEVHGAPADMVALNAGASLYVAGRADTLGSGVKLAQDTLRAGHARDQLEALVQHTHTYARADGVA